MTLGRRHGGWVIVLSFVLALLVTIIALPDWIAYLWPDQKAWFARP